MFSSSFVSSLCVCVCVCANEHVCVHMCVCACMCVQDNFAVVKPVVINLITNFRLPPHLGGWGRGRRV